MDNVFVLNGFKDTNETNNSAKLYSEEGNLYCGLEKVQHLGIR